MIHKVDVWPDVFARLIKAVRQDCQFRAGLVFKREEDPKFFGTGGGKSLVNFLKDTKVNLDTGKMSVTLEVSETFGASEELLDVPRTVPDALFDILGIFPRVGKDDGRHEIVAELKQNVGKIWALSGNPMIPSMREPITRIDELLNLLEKS